MARAAQAGLGAGIRGGLVVGPVAVAVDPPLVFIQGEHPEPGAGSETAGREVLALCDALPDAAQLLVLLSGGASALMVAPAEGIRLEDKRAAAQTLMRAGADIYALNTVRKHASAVKGGWLAARSRAACRTLAISDVIGDDLSVIGSGPTVADPSTFRDALDILDRFGGAAAYPRAIVERFENGVRGLCPETPKPHDPRLARSVATVVGGRHDAMRGAAEAARARGYRTVVVEEALRGEAREAGLAHLERCVQEAAIAAGPVCVVASGEPTVTVTGEGRGGRNQEFVLAAVERLAGFQGPMAMASVGTDGVDGPTPAAGAIVDSTTAARARSAGLSPGASLAANDSFAFFSALGDLISTGPTGTNVGDLQIFLSIS